MCTEYGGMEGGRRGGEGAGSMPPGRPGQPFILWFTVEARNYLLTALFRGIGRRMND